MTYDTAPEPGTVPPGPCNCEELLEQLYEFVDSEISEAQCARLREHVRLCPTCREATDAETHLRLLLRRSCAETAPTGLRLRVVAQISMLRARD
ncbi:mycothiol system anti-sigma-R factor [Georgenia sunbinii]|uniref:mycothiol system anti-sigma-R factor n=1 Tax=Georgenia sunbinii TaxID=3117728 RepID=UPI002F26D045